jgi:excisionase family DNA binding protein
MTQRNISEALLPPWCDVETAGQWLGVSKWLVYDLCRSGRLRSVKLGRLLRIPRSALLAFGEDEGKEIARPGLQADGRANDTERSESRYGR